jgi:hypothetical protein
MMAFHCTRCEWWGGELQLKERRCPACGAASDPFHPVFVSASMVAHLRAMAADPTEEPATRDQARAWLRVAVVPRPIPVK